MYYRVQSEGVTNKINYRGEDVFEFDVNSGWTIYSVTFDDDDLVIHITKVNNPKKDCSIDQVHFAIDDAPSIDIVRCGECKHYYNEDPEQIPTASIMCSHMHPDDFCSYGEREGE